MSNCQQPFEIEIPMPWGFIAACWYGDRRKQPVLALHGWQDNAGTFARLAPLIAAHRPILAIDLPGHGRSSHYPAGMQYHTLDYMRVIGHVVKYYKWEKVSLMGHSMGAVVCFIYTSLFPQMVDMLIAIDSLATRYHPLPVQMTILQIMVEKALVDDERLMQKCVDEEPPLYTFEKLERLLHAGSEHSIDLAHCRHILERSVTQSAKQPDKYYFSRDARVKQLCEFSTPAEMRLKMAQRIRNVNFLIIKGLDSYHLNQEADPVIAVLRQNNPNFERYDVAGKHHLHLNNPKEVAKYAIPFVQKYRPIEAGTKNIGTVSKL